jgi:glycosyltransferase involved in cell wall biosynthesis
MRILSLSNCPLDERLGSGYVTLRYARGLRERGHEVELLGPSEFEPLHRLGRGIGYRQAIGMAAASLRRVAASDYDVVEFWGGEAWLAISLLARLPRRRFLLVARSNGLETHCAELLAARHAGGDLDGREPWYHPDPSRLMAAGFRRADALVTVAEFDRQYGIRRGYVPAARLLAIDNPLPDEYLGLEVDLEREPLIGYCGSWIPRKGVSLIVQDLPLLLREFPAWRLLLAGVGERFDPARHFPPDVLPRIEVVPFLERSELRSLYQRLAIAILPSHYESFGLVAAEAMACGCALVASRVGFAASLRDGDEAVLLAETAHPALYHAVRRLILNEPLRRAVATAGRRRVQGLQWPSATARLEASYQQWLAERRGRNGASA